MTVEGQEFNQLKSLLFELSVAYPHNTRIKQGIAHTDTALAGLATTAATQELFRKIEAIGGQEIMARIDETITRKPGERLTIVEIHERLQSIANNI